jgi:bacteriocin biosynthesis cyclodehydratase domain-containing protein
MHTNRWEQLVALPVHIIEVPEGLLVKRGAIELVIKGTDAAKAVRLVLDATGNGGASRSHIQNLFARSDRKQIDGLIDKLIERHMLAPAEETASSAEVVETNLDIFFSNFGETKERAMRELGKTHLVIVGVNSIARQLVLSLAVCGYSNYLVLDDPRHRNVRFFNEAGKLKKEEWPASLDWPRSFSTSRPNELGDCLVATSDFGGERALCQWNKTCLDHKVKFLPVILKNLMGYVGPFVLPGDTPCFECTISRLRSHSRDAQVEDLIDSVAFDTQRVVGFHPAMATILGAIAAFEITRFFSGSLPKREPGQMLEIDLLAGKMMDRTVLKVPRCAACSPLHKSSVTNIKKILFPDDTRSQ